MHEVPVEEVVEVLVGGDPRHHLVAGRVVEQLAGVAVGDAGRQLLERDVDEAVRPTLGGSGTTPAAHLVHAGPLERDGSSDRVTVR